MMDSTAGAGTPMVLGCIGLGAMGFPMAACMVSAGHVVRGFDPRPEPGQQLQALGGVAAATAADAARGAQLVLLMVHNAEQARQALFGAQGAAQALAASTCASLPAITVSVPARALVTPPLTGPSSRPMPSGSRLEARSRAS
jgi:putative dehydrogenase